MILGSALVCKIGLIIVIILFAVHFTWGKLRKKGQVLLAVACIFSGIIANAAVFMVPPLTDTVSLTALGKTGEGAEGKEVFITSYTVDGDVFAPTNAIEGKWFWYGELYGWRPESDSRQPTGTTRGVTLEVPVGWSRTIDFSKGQWRGWVSVTTADGTQEIDTSVVGQVSIGRSNTQTLLFNQIKILAVYTIVCFILCGLCCLCAMRWAAIHEWRKKHPGVLLFAGIAAVQLIIALHYAGIDSFWHDELYEIGWSVESNSLLDRMFVGNAILPIYGLIFGLWYTIAPYGEEWLLLISELATAGGVFFIGMCGKEWKNVRTGAFASGFAALSGTLLVQCSYEIRSYALFFFFGALLFYLYLRRWRHLGQETLRETLFLGTVMIFFAGMHYHAVVFCGGLFLVDCFLFFKNKIRLRSIIPYLMAALSYVPNLIYILETRYILRLDTRNWQPIPSLDTVLSAIQYLAGDSTWVVVLFWLGAAVTAASVLFLPRGQADDTPQEIRIKSILPLFLAGVVFAFFYLYGKYVNQTVTMWHNRYFCDLVPCILLLSSNGADWICSGVKHIYKDNKIAERAIVLFLCLAILPSMYLTATRKGQTVKEPNRGAIDWLYAQLDIYNQTTLAISGENSPPIIGLQVYYMTQQGRRDPINLQSCYAVDPTQFSQYDTVYVYRWNISGWLKETLQTQFGVVQEDKNLKIVKYQRVTE